MHTKQPMAFAVRISLWISIFLLPLFAYPASAEKRVALVIGNGAYEHAPALRNPANDAAAIADALGRLGFEVTSGIDLSHRDMREIVRKFSTAIEGADVALFFYAGHGMQVWGENYLIPIDAALEDEADLDFAAVKLDLIMRQMMRDARVKIVVLDACRDNPLSRTLARSMGRTRSAQAIAPGLAKMNTGAGSLIAFATEPGDVALDGEARNSPFTAALVQHMAEPGVEIQTVMTRVRGAVYKQTGERQLPWVNTSLTGEFYLAPAAEQPPPGPAVDVSPATGRTVDEQLELALWQSAETTGHPQAYQEYLRQYPGGRFAAIAKLRLEQPVEKPAAPAVRHEDESAAAARAAEENLGLSASERAEVQRRLSLLGFDTRGVDGALGANTRRAIQRWQQKGGFPATGYLDEEQYAALIEQSDRAYAAWQAAQRPQRMAVPTQPPAPVQPARQSAAPTAPQQQGPSIVDVMKGASGLIDALKR